jgi:LysM repeat protein
VTNPFTQSQVQAMALQVGWKSADAKIIAAIAMVESAYSSNGISYADADKEGDQNLVNSVYGYSYGLTQIRSMWSQANTGQSRDSTRLKDPKFNLSSALTLFKQGGFGIWSTYNSGQYKAYLQGDYPPAPGTYVVVSGDSLVKIAGKYTGFTWQQLAQVNGLQKPYTIYIGQPLQLPVWDYHVQSGDTLTTIAAKYSKVTPTQLASYNSITNPNVIYVGQLIRIPDPLLLK